MDSDRPRRRSGSQLKPYPLGDLLDDLNSFETLAEISVALAGFTGIVLALGRRALGEIGDLDRARIIDLLVSAFGTALFAFVPRIVTSFVESPAIAWRSSHALFAVYHAASLVTFILALRGTPARQIRSDLVLAAGSVVVLAAQAGAALGLVPSHVYGIYLVALIWLVVISAWQFSLLLLEGWHDA